METWRILVNFHHMAGAGYYEIAIGASVASLVLQYYLKRRGNEEGAKLIKGLTLLGLGAVCIEAIMKMLHMIGQILV